MKSKCSVYIAASVDGYIARPDGSIDWLERPEYAVTNLQGLTYDAFITGIDALVMGRKSYEMVLTFAEWPYTVPVVVLSRHAVTIPAVLQDKVQWMQGEPQDIIDALAAEDKYHLYIDGGYTIQQFLRVGLIDEMTITRIPILLGDGIPLFAPSGMELSLSLVEAVSSPNGFVQERYCIKK